MLSRMLPILRGRKVIRGEDGSILGYGKPVFSGKNFLGYAVKRGTEKFFVHRHDAMRIHGGVILKPDCINRADEIIERLRDMDRFAHPRIITKELIDIEREASEVLKQLKDLVVKAQKILASGKTDSPQTLQIMINEAKKRIFAIENSRTYRKILQLEKRASGKEYSKRRLIMEIEKLGEKERAARIKKILKKIDEILFG